MSAIRDAAQRERALDVAQSFIIQAPAGSGKTSLLTQRFLGLLTTVERPEQIVAITFTRKAAGEMQHRIMAMLEAAQAVHSGTRPEPTNDHDRRAHALATAALRHAEAKRWGLLENPAMLRVQTIDAFCASLVRQMPLLSQMGQCPEPAERPETLYQQAARNTLAQLEAEGDVALAVKALLGHLAFNVDKLEGLLVGLLAKRDQWIRLLAPLWQEAQGGVPLSAPLREFLEGSLDAVVNGALEAAAAEHGDSLEALAPLARYAAGHRAEDPVLTALSEWEGHLDGTAADLPLWRALRQLLLTGTGAARKKVTKADGFPTTKDGGTDGMKESFMAILEGMSEELVASLLANAGLPEPAYPEHDLAAINALLVVLKQAALELMLVFTEAGEVDFAEIQGRALLALGEECDPSDLALALDYRLRHLLVDEFQDTSNGQFRLLERLTSAWLPGDGHTITVVGDPMQSIYRFREADVGLFLKAQETGIGNLPLESLVLCANFRSTAGIVAWNNATFAQVFPAASDMATGAVSYSASDGIKAADTETPVTIWPYYGFPGESEAADILSILRAGERKAGESVAILVRTRNDVVEIAQELRQNGVPYRAVEIERLSGRQSIQDMMALTRALLTLGDRVNWLAILRAPWCGLTLADLFALVGANDALHRTVWEQINRPDVVATLSADGQQRLARVSEVFAGLLVENGRLSLRERVEKAWWQLGGDRLLRSAAEMQDAMAFLALLSSQEARGGLDEATFDDEVARLFATPEAVPDIVEILTIHKSKGLEFDTVILPGLGSRPRGEDAALLLWEEMVLPDRDETGLLLAPIRHADAAESPLYQYIAGLKQVKGRHEAVRLLYVAATRAKRKLHLLARASLKANGDISPAKGSSLELLWPALAAHFHAEPAEDAGEREQASGVAWEDIPVPPLQRVPLAAITELSPLTAPPAITRATADPLPAVLSDHNRILGIVAHRLLEEFARQGLAAWSTERLRISQSQLIRLLAQQGLVGDRQAAAQEIIALLNACLLEPKFRWIFDPAHALQPEFEILVPDEGVLRRRRLDLLFRDGEGVRWIVDWKSDHGNFEDEALVRAHGEQLRRYRAAVEALEPGDVRMGVYSLRQQRFVEVS